MCLGGAENVLRDTLIESDKKVLSSTLVTLFHHPGSGEIFKKHQIPYFSLNLSSRYAWCQALKKLTDILRAEPFDVIHTHLFYSNVYGRLAVLLNQVPCVVTTLHSPDYALEEQRKWKSILRKYIDKWTSMATKCHHLAVSPHVKKDYEEKLSFKNIVILSNAIEVSRFQHCDKKRELMRQQLKLSHHEILILTIGRLYPKKGLSCFIESCVSLRQRHLPIKAVIVGDGPLEWELRNLVTKHKLNGVITFLGKSSLIQELLSACDIFVCPSLCEGFGLALLEAMACGKPIVCSDIAPLNTLVRHKEEALLFPAADSKQLTEGILFMMSHKKQALYMGNNARRRAKEYDVNQYVKKLEMYYRHLVKESA